MERIDRGQYRLVRRALPTRAWRWPRLSGEGFFVPIESDLRTRCLPRCERPQRATGARPGPLARQNESEIAVDPFIGSSRFASTCRRPDAVVGAWNTGLDEGVARSLPWDASTGLRWAQLLADLRAAGRALPIKDSLIAPPRSFWLAWSREHA